VVDLEEQGLVGLDDERTIHARLPFCDGLGTGTARPNVQFA